MKEKITKKKIENFYYDYEHYIEDLKSSEEIYQIAFQCITSRNKKMDIVDIIYSLKGIKEIFKCILETQNDVIIILKDNELINDYFLLIALIINHVNDKILKMLNYLYMLRDNKEYTADLFELYNIYDITNELVKFLEYIYDGICEVYYNYDY